MTVVGGHYALHQMRLARRCQPHTLHMRRACARTQGWRGARGFTDAELHGLAFHGRTAAPAGRAQRFPCAQNLCSFAVSVRAMPDR